MVHFVGLAERHRIIRLSLRLSQIGEHPLKLIERRGVFTTATTAASGVIKIDGRFENTLACEWDHVELLHARGHVAGGAEVGEADVAALGAAVLARPVLPRVELVRVRSVLSGGVNVIKQILQPF